MPKMPPPRDRRIPFTASAKYATNDKPKVTLIKKRKPSPQTISYMFSLAPQANMTDIK
jgi:hypothetical protein